MHPTFTVFFPGHMPYTSVSSATTLPFKERGFALGKFSAKGLTIGLPRLKTFEERRRYIRDADSGMISDLPPKEIPNFLRLLNKERVAVGLQPVQEPER
jgi:hypothetical protein